ncbi:MULTISPECIES: YpiB family protein [Salinicoccus]|uniref:YpiB family protein n=2 Tax=Salinicoccus TaxID=45669 RepID=A0ABV5Z1A0_9STAP
MTNTMKYRKDFIDYILYNYDFDDRIAVWILNFIKSHPDISSNIHFQDDQEIERHLKVASSGQGPTLMLEKGNTITVDGEVIFHELNMNQDEPLLLTFRLGYEDNRYEQIKELESSLDEELMALSRTAVLSQIDEALDRKDHDRFIKLTDYLQKTNR